MWARLMLHGLTELVALHDLELDLRRFPGTVGLVFPAKVMSDAQLKRYNPANAATVAKWAATHEKQLQTLIARGRYDRARCQEMLREVELVAKRPMISFKGGGKTPTPVQGLSLPRGARMPLFLRVALPANAKEGRGGSSPSRCAAATRRRASSAAARTGSRWYRRRSSDEPRGGPRGRSAGPAARIAAGGAVRSPADGDGRDCPPEARVGRAHGGRPGGAAAARADRAAARRAAHRRALGEPRPRTSGSCSRPRSSASCSRSRSARARRRRRDARLLLIGLAFVVSAGFLGLHALATPGVRARRARTPGSCSRRRSGSCSPACFAAASAIEYRLADLALDRPARAPAARARARADRGVGGRLARRAAAAAASRSRRRR